MVAQFPTIKTLKMSNSFENIIKSEKPVLIDFSATWCGPCKMLAPILKQVKDSLGERVAIFKRRIRCLEKRRVGIRYCELCFG